MKNKQERWPQLGLRGLDGGQGQAWLPSGALPVSVVLNSLGRLQHQPGAASWAEGWGKEKPLSQNGFPMTCFLTICADPIGNSKEGDVSDESIKM